MTSLRRKTWRVLEAAPGDVDGLVHELGVSRLTAQVLAAQGFARPAAAREFLAPALDALPDPSLLPDIDAAAGRLAHAVTAGETVGLFSDYDVDGVSSAATLATFLNGLGVRTAHQVPNRFRDGYGLNAGGFQRLRAQGVTLTVALDIGTSNAAEIAAARAMGIETIVIDHHQVPEARPACVALVNPHRDDNHFPDRNLCSAGLTFYLCLATRRRLRDARFFASRPEPNLKRLLAFTALGTVADMVPLTGANRILVYHGLRELRRPAFPGIRALLDVSGCRAEAVTAGQISFRLGPRINAAGRLDDASAALQLLMSTGHAGPTGAGALATALDAANRERQHLEKHILAEAIEDAERAGGQDGPPAFVLARDGWHAGVAGIVASKIVERYHRPTILLCPKEPGASLWLGSGRTPAGLNLYETLKACAPLLGRFGGHRAAAGLALEAAQIPAFREAFAAAADAGWDTAHRAPSLTIATMAQATDIEPGAAAELERLGPHGFGNPRPIIGLPRVELRGVRRMGHDGSHLTASILATGATGGRTLRAVAFGAGDDAASLGGPCDVAVQAELQNGGPEAHVEVHIKGVR